MIPRIQGMPDPNDPEFQKFMARRAGARPPMTPPSYAEGNAMGVTLPPRPTQPPPARLAAPPVAQEALPPEPEERNKVWQYADAILSGLGSGRKPYDQAHYDRIDQQALQAQQADPRSRASAIARNRMAPVLSKLGFMPEEIGQFSAADINEMSKGGNLVRSIAGAREKAAAAKAAREQLIADRAYKEQEFNRQAGVTGNTAAGKKERAEIVAGASAQGREDAQMFQAEQQRATQAFQQDQQQRAQAFQEEMRKKQQEYEDKRLRASHPELEDYSQPGWTVSDEKRARFVVRNNETRQKLEDAADADRVAQAALGDMIAIHDRVGTTAFDDQAASDYETARADFMSAVAKMKGTGALNEADEKRFASMVPSIKPGMTWGDLKELGGFGNKSDVLKGAASYMQRRTETAMSGWGYKREARKPAAQQHEDSDLGTEYR